MEGGCVRFTWVKALMEAVLTSFTPFTNNKQTTIKCGGLAERPQKIKANDLREPTQDNPNSTTCGRTPATRAGMWPTKAWGIGVKPYPTINPLRFFRLAS